MISFPTQIQGILWMVLTGFLAVCIYAVMRHLSSAYGLHPFQLVLFYNIGGLLFYLPFLLRRLSSVRTSRIRLYIARALLEFSGFSLSVIGLTMLPLPTHTALGFTSPLFGSLAAVLVLKEANSVHRWLSLLIGFIGVLIVTQPTSHSLDVGALYVLAASLCFAFCGVCIKKLTCTEPPQRIGFYMLVLTAIVAAPFALAQWQPVTVGAIPFLLLMGLLVAMVQMTVSLAYSKADVTVILPFNFMNLIWSSLIALLFFDELVSRMTILGAIVILAGACYGIHHASRANMLATTRAAAGGS